MGKKAAIPGEISLRVAQLMTSLHSESGLKRAELAEMAGIAEGRVSELLNGQKAWYLEDVQKMCDAMGLDVWQVLALAERRVSATQQDFALVAKNKGRRPRKRDNDGFYDN